jgi:hypothetical protein
MLILFDHGTPAPLIPFLEGQTVTKAKDAGWDRLGACRDEKADYEESITYKPWARLYSL